jgi:thiamine biosynthesis lipoprotein
MKAPAALAAPARLHRETPDRGLRRVDPVMGTVVTIDVRDPGVDPAAADAALVYLHDIDARFSPFRPESEVSRLARGEIREDECSPDLRHVLSLCEDLRRTSDGYFDIRGHRPDGLLDPCGMVKGWAVEEASRIIEAAGARDYFINAGGDVIAAGGPEPGGSWRVGIRHPREVDRLAAVLAVRDRPIAHGPATDGAAVAHGGRARPHVGGRLCDGRIRDGGGRDRLGGPARGLRRVRDHRRRSHTLDRRSRQAAGMIVACARDTRATVGPWLERHQGGRGAPAPHRG